MDNKTFVTLRETDQKIEVSIAGKQKPDIPKEIIKKWQNIINIMAKIINVPAGLIMRITKDSMVVFLKSQSKSNPYPVGGNDSLGHGLYCETVIGKDEELLVEDALRYESWENNPDVKLGMISYLGLPLKWPDQEFFGTICVLDKKENHYSDIYRDLLKEFKLAIEADLKNILYQKKLEYYATMDILGECYNRNTIEKKIKKLFIEYIDKKDRLSISVMDINGLKSINDEFGHNRGDSIIKTFSKAIQNVLDDDFLFGRWGGDEFLLIYKDKSYLELKKLLNEKFNEILSEIQKVAPLASFCYGIASNKNVKDYQELVKIADEDMYKCKKESRENYF